MIQYDGITIRDISKTSAHSDVAQFAALPRVDVSVDIVTDNNFMDQAPLWEPSVSPHREGADKFTKSIIIRLLISAGFIQVMIQSLLACLQTGGG